MINCKAHALGPLDTNCYLVWNESDDTRPAFLIDPADAGDFLTDQILEEQVDLQAILLTHGHIDHLMGATELALNFNLPVLVHPADQFLVDRSVETAKHWFGLDILPPPPTAPLPVGNACLSLGTATFSVYETPGHTPGSVSIVSDSADTVLESHMAFVGDVIFADGYGRTDFSYASAVNLRQSLDYLQTKLPANTVGLAGHGNPFNWSGRWRG